MIHKLLKQHPVFKKIIQFAIFKDLGEKLPDLSYIYESFDLSVKIMPRFLCLCLLSIYLRFMIDKSWFLQSGQLISN